MTINMSTNTNTNTNRNMKTAEQISMDDFRSVHPYRLADGRRFASLHCAAQSVLVGGTPNLKLMPIINTTTGVTYDMSACKRAVQSPPTPAKGVINPMSPVNSLIGSLIV